MFPSKPVAVRATKTTNAQASSGSTRTDLSFAGSLFRKTAAIVNIDKQRNASSQPPRDALSRPPHQPSAAPAASESRLPNGNTHRAIIGTEKITQPIRKTMPANATAIIADSTHLRGSSKISSGQNNRIVPARKLTRDARLPMAIHCSRQSANPPCR